VGNVLNSINVSANFIQDKVLNSKAKNLKRVIDMVSDHAGNLGEFLTEDERGKHVPVYLAEVAKLIIHEQKDITAKLCSLTKNVEHIKQIIKAQQGYARAGGVEVFININDVIEDAIEINSAILMRDEVDLKLDLAELSKVYLDKQRVLQILVNLITNARYALSKNEKQKRLLVIRCGKHDENTLRIDVTDNGIGIPEENLAKIFRHGFTTRESGHGFGLHSSALAAKEMGGSLTVHSDGQGHGATFTLELPLKLGEVVQNSQGDVS
jgi:signal transduction histidine kinase